MCFAFSKQHHHWCKHMPVTTASQLNANSMQRMLTCVTSKCSAQSLPRFSAQFTSGIKTTRVISKKSPEKRLLCFCNIYFQSAVRVKFIMATTVCTSYFCDHCLSFMTHAMFRVRGVARKDGVILRILILIPTESEGNLSRKVFSLKSVITNLHRSRRITGREHVHVYAAFYIII